MLKISWSKIVILYLSILLTGCSRVTTSAVPDTVSTPTLPSGISPVIPTAQTPVTPGLESLIEKAKADLAQRLSISMDQINVLDAENVMWPDVSIGCPQTGMVYAQVLTPGYLIRLEYNHQQYEYHASKSLEVIYCENPTPPFSGTPGNT